MHRRIEDWQLLLLQFSYSNSKSISKCKVIRVRMIRWKMLGSWRV